MYHALLPFYQVLCPGCQDKGVEKSHAVLGTNCLEGPSWKYGKRLKVFCSASEFSNFAIQYITSASFNSSYSSHVCKGELRHSKRR